MDDRDGFVASMKERHAEAERALLNGDPALYLAMWSTRDPVTVMGATGRDVTITGSTSMLAEGEQHDRDQEGVDVAGPWPPTSPTTCRGCGPGGVAARWRRRHPCP